MARRFRMHFRPPHPERPSNDATRQERRIVKLMARDDRHVNELINLTMTEYLLVKTV
jgi:hypothetical protein